jgi:thymidylate synthase
MISEPVYSIADAHKWLMQEIIWKHQEIPTEDGETTWESEPLAITIECPLVDMINPKSSFQRQRCDEYAKQLIEGVQTNQILSERFSYTYHERLYHESQFSDIIKRLKTNPLTRRAVLYTWLPPIDNQSDEVPCLQQIQYTIRNNRLNCCTVFRSNDILSAFGPNAYGLVKLQDHVARELKFPVGTYTHVALIPHLYSVRDRADLMRWM